MDRFPFLVQKNQALCKTLKAHSWSTTNDKDRQFNWKENGTTVAMSVDEMRKRLWVQPHLLFRNSTIPTFKLIDAIRFDMCAVVI